MTDEEKAEKLDNEEWELTLKDTIERAKEKERIEQVTEKERDEARRELRREVMKP